MPSAFSDTVEKYKKSLAIFLPSRDTIKLNVTNNGATWPRGAPDGMQYEVHNVKDSCQKHLT